MSYFFNTHNESEIKDRFRDLCRQYHPDLAGDESTRAMQDINAEYKERLRGEYRKTKTNDEAEEAVEMDERAAEVLRKIIGLEGIEIELVGRWIWVTGDTFNVREVLKSAGLKWASKKRAWYWHTPEDRMRGGKKSLDQIRQTYGSKPLRNAYSNRIAA